MFMFPVSDKVDEPKFGFGPISASLGISLQMTAPDVDLA